VEDDIIGSVVWGVEIRFRHQYIRVGVKGLECSDPSIEELVNEEANYTSREPARCAEYVINF
jgi:hypothetical protein